jgi:predicted AAA+ superfamily ATPase
MRFLPRTLETVLLKARRNFPAVVLTGPRRVGKTSLLRHVLPGTAYRLLEDPDVLARVRADPRGFFDELKPPVILDEIQNAPELLAYVRTRIDAAPRKAGQWFLTGSQESALMLGVSESMAGRAAILHLLPLSVQESPKVDLWLGGFPEVIARPGARDLWFGSYLQTYLERDVRAVTQVKDLATFRRFMGLVASRHGQILNKTDLAGPLGVSVPTIAQWMGVLETTGLLALIPPYFENFGKRLLKSPRLYWLDSGLASHLLGLRSRSELERSPFYGALWEGFVAAEIIKRQINSGGRRELYHFRDEQGLEVDFVLPGPQGKLRLVEVKASRTPAPAMARPLQALGRALGERAEMWLVHRPSRTPVGTTALAPGVKAADLATFLQELQGSTLSRCPAPSAPRPRKTPRRR